MCGSLLWIPRLIGSCLVSAVFRAAATAGFCVVIVVSLYAAEPSLIFEAIHSGDAGTVDRLLADQPDLVHSRDEYGCMPLHVACLEARKEIVEILLSRGADVNARTQEEAEATPLLCAVWASPPEGIRDPLGAINGMVALLLEKGARPDSATVQGVTALHVAAERGLYRVAGTLIASGVPVNAATDQGWTPLHEAVRLDHQEDMVRLLLEHGANPLAKDHRGLTPFARAVYCCCKVASGSACQLVEAFLANERKADIHIEAKSADLKGISARIAEDPESAKSSDELGWTVLHWATWYRQPEVVELLLQSGADVDCKDLSDLRALDLAAARGWKEIAAILIRSGAEVERKGACGRTALHWAVECENIGVAEVLLRVGAPVDDKDAWGNTALCYACEDGLTRLVRLLLKHGADPNAPAAGGYSPVHAAVMGRAPAVMKVLVAAGADVNARDRYGDTALHLACAHDTKEIARILVTNGADVNAENIAGRTPLDVAIEHRHEDIVDLLKRHHGEDY